jgi:hypothetical protein
VGDRFGCRERKELPVDCAPREKVRVASTKLSDTGSAESKPVRFLVFRHQRLNLVENRGQALRLVNHDP